MAKFLATQTLWQSPGRQVPRPTPPHGPGPSLGQSIQMFECRSAGKQFGRLSLPQPVWLTPAAGQKAGRPTNLSCWPLGVKRRLGLVSAGCISDSQLMLTVIELHSPKQPFCTPRISVAGTVVALSGQHVRLGGAADMVARRSCGQAGGLSKNGH